MRRIHRVASTPEIATQSTSETITWRRQGIQKDKLKALYGLFKGYFFLNKISLCQRDIWLLPTSASLKTAFTLIYN